MQQGLEVATLGRSIILRIERPAGKFYFPPISEAVNQAPPAGAGLAFAGSGGEAAAFLLVVQFQLSAPKTNTTSSGSSGTEQEPAQWVSPTKTEPAGK